MSGFKITTLVENSVSASLSLIGEHGLSFLIETDRQKILFDTGQGCAILRNADALGIDLSSIDTVVLSHGHYDHAGGVKSLLTRNTSFTLIAHPGVFEHKLICRNGKDMFIGFSESNATLEQCGVRLCLKKTPVEIAPGIMTTGEIPMNTDVEAVEDMFFKTDMQGRIPDTFSDENALILDTEKGIVVVLGCAHRGVINTLNHVSHLSGNKKIHAIIGGLHLVSAGTDKLRKITDLLQEFHIEKMIVGHCTGFKGMAEIFYRFKDALIPNIVGHQIEF